MLGLGEGELELLGERSREMVTADRHIALPDTGAVGDDQIRVVGPDVEHDDRIFRARALELIEADEVIKSNGAHLHDVNLDARHRQRQDRASDLIALHGEETDLGHGELFVAGLLIAADLLVRPDDLIQGKRNLLLGLEFDDIRNSLLFDRRQLDELDKSRPARAPR